MSGDGGLAKFQKRMREIPAGVRESVVPSLVKSGDELAGTMKQLAQHSKDSGALIDSITVTLPGQATPAYSQPGGSRVAGEYEVVVTAGNREVRYAHLVEYGTAERINKGLFAGTANPGTEAQPFFWPSVRLLKKRVRSRIRRSIGKAVRSHWGKP